MAQRESCDVNCSWVGVGGERSLEPGVGKSGEGCAVRRSPRDTASAPPGCSAGASFVFADIHLPLAPPLSSGVRRRGHWERWRRTVVRKGSAKRPLT